MPSPLHEFILTLLRNQVGASAYLLNEIDAPIPNHDEVRTESSDLSNLVPTEFRADLVLFLMRKSQKVLGIVVEVQLKPDENKRYSWPAYIANLRARHRCPVCMLVVTHKRSVAHWAQKCIELGPGTRCQPWVIDPSNMPVIKALADAEANVELAFLSAIEHARDTDFAETMRIIVAAITAGDKKLDTNRFDEYVELLTHYLEESAPKAFRVIMSSAAYEFKSEFARCHFGRGKKAGEIEGRIEGQNEGRKEGRKVGQKEGRIEERVELILKILAARFGTLTKEVRTRVRGARDALSDKFVKQMMKAKTIEQVLELL